MNITLSVIKADIGSIGGHIAPSRALLDAVRLHVVEQGKGLVIDHYVSHTGDDIAIVMSHRHGPGRSPAGSEGAGRLASAPAAVGFEGVLRRPSCRAGKRS